MNCRMFHRKERAHSCDSWSIANPDPRIVGFDDTPDNQGFDDLLPAFLYEATKRESTLSGYGSVGNPRLSRIHARSDGSSRRPFW